MSIDLIFNELSEQPMVANILQARELMSGFIETITEARKLGVSNNFRVLNSLDSIILAPEYPLSKWRNDQDVAREYRQRIKSIQTKCPLLVDCQNEQNRALEVEGKHKERKAQGFTASMLLSGLSISFKNHEDWNTSQITLDISEIDTGGEISNYTVQIPHASESQHIQQLQIWIKSKSQVSFTNGTHLWERKEHFSSLEFCNSVKSDLAKILSSDDLLQQVINKLGHLNEAAKNWNSGQFNLNQLPFKSSPESQSTLQQFKSARTFSTPSGNDLIFSLHCRITPHSWRIHFFPDHLSKKVIIGYIGPHLPIAS